MMNHGRIQIASDSGYWKPRDGRVRTNRLSSAFPGTVVNLEINTADEAAYCLASETKLEDIFCLSFLNVESLTSAFLNSAVGQLYSNFSEDAIRAAVSVTDIPPDDAALLKRVVDTAKQYFSNPARFREATEEVLGVE